MPLLRSVLTAALIGVLAIPTVGQAQPVKLGLHVGGHLASLRGAKESLLLSQPIGSGPDAQASWGHRTGIQAGVVLQFEVSQWVVVQPELTYVQKGGTATAPLVRGVEVDQTTQYGYLEFPVLARLRLPTGGRLEPSVVAGPFFGLNVRAENEGQIRTQLSPSGGGSRRETITAPGTEWGVVVGGEVAYVFSTGNALSLGVRYSRGLTDIGPVGSDVGNAEGSVRSDVIGVQVGYVVPL